MSSYSVSEWFSCKGDLVTNSDKVTFRAVWGELKTLKSNIFRIWFNNENYTNVGNEQEIMILIQQLIVPMLSILILKKKFDSTMRRIVPALVILIFNKKLKIWFNNEENCTSVGNINLEDKNKDLIQQWGELYQCWRGFRSFQLLLQTLGCFKVVRSWKNLIQFCPCSRNHSKKRNNIHFQSCQILTKIHFQTASVKSFAWKEYLAVLFKSSLTSHLDHKTIWGNLNTFKLFFHDHDYDCNHGMTCLRPWPTKMTVWNCTLLQCLVCSLLFLCLYNLVQMSWNITNRTRDLVYCSLSTVFCTQRSCKNLHDTNLLWSMWCTAGEGAGVKNAFWGEIDFSTGFGHLFAPHHFSCPLENGPILANCDKLWTSSPIHASEKKILDHHIGKCNCQCWKRQAIRYK